MNRLPADYHDRASCVEWYAREWSWCMYLQQIYSQGEELLPIRLTNFRSRLWIGIACSDFTELEKYYIFSADFCTEG